MKNMTKVFEFKRIALLIILESPGSVEDKAVLIFELFSTNHIMTETDLDCLLNDIFTIAVKQLT